MMRDVEESKFCRSDINKSQAECTVENGAIRLGFNYVTTLGETGGKRIEEARGNKPFIDLVDFYKRTRLPQVANPKSDPMRRDDGVENALS